MDPNSEDERLERPRKNPSDEQIAHAEQRASRGLPAFTWKQYVRRMRHVRFVEAFMLEWLRRGSVDEAVTRAALYAFKGLTAVGARKKGWDTLKRPDVCQAVEAAFAQNGYSFTDIVLQHIEHIKGGLTRTKIVETTDKEGKIVSTTRTIEETLPDYTALRDLERMIVPNQPQKFEFANTTKKHVGGVIAGDSGAPEVQTDEFPKLSAKIERDEVQVDTDTSA